MYNCKEKFDFDKQKAILKGKHTEKKLVILEKPNESEEQERNKRSSEKKINRDNILKNLKGRKLTEEEVKKYREYNTILASSKKFKTDFKKLLIDRTSGKISSDATFVVPSNFDGRVVWKDYVFPPRDQGLCGGSWAFAVSSVLSDRLSIYTNKKYKYQFSPAEMILCDMGGEDEYKFAQENAKDGIAYDFNMPGERLKVIEEENAGINKYGCNGETLIGGWQFAFRFGLVTEDCASYNDDIYNYGGNIVGSCTGLLGDTYDLCPNSKHPVISHVCQGYYYVPGTPKNENVLEQNGSERDIRRDIYRWGPTSTALKVYEDLVNWNSPDRIYEWDGKSKYLGGQAVCIVGWGQNEAMKYWIVRNSWGSKWNGDGHFKILRGKNHCEIEENVFVGFPNLYGIRLYVEWPLLTKTEDLALRAIWGIADSGYKRTTCENLISGKMLYDPELFKDNHIDEDLYLKEYWPDVSTLVAAEPEKIKYKLADTKNFRRQRTNVQTNDETITNFLEGVSNVVVVLYFILFAFLLFVLLKGLHYGLYYLKIIKRKPNIF